MKVLWFALYSEENGCFVITTIRPMGGGKITSRYVGWGTHMNRYNNWVSYKQHFAIRGQRYCFFLN